MIVETSSQLAHFQTKQDELQMLSRACSNFDAADKVVRYEWIVPVFDIGLFGVFQ